MKTTQKLYAFEVMATTMTNEVIQRKGEIIVLHDIANMISTHHITLHYNSSTANTAIAPAATPPAANELAAPVKSWTLYPVFIGMCDGIKTCN